MGTFYDLKTKNRYSATVMEFPVNHFPNLDMSVEMVTAGTIRLPNHSMKNINTGKKNICNLHIQPVL